MGEKKDQVLNQIGITVCIALVLLVAWVFFLENLVMDLMNLDPANPSQASRWVFSLATLGILGCALIYPCRKLFSTRSLLKDTEQALQEERMFNRIVNNVDASIVIVTDGSGKITELNQKAGQVLGYRGKDILGKDWAQVLMPESFRNQARKLLQGILNDRNKSVETFKSPVICKNKTELTIDWQAGPLHREQGATQGIILSGIDITAQFQLKGELDSVINRYEPQIKQLSTHLSDSKRKLEEEVHKNREARVKFQFWVDFDDKLLSLDDPLKNNRDEVDERVNNILFRLGKITHSDSGYVFLFVDQNMQMINSHIWSKADPDLTASPDDWIDLDIFPWFKTKIGHQEIVHAKNLDDLPGDASNEKEVFQSQGVKSFINVPMVWKNQSIGYIGFETTGQEKSWSADEISMIRIFSKTLAPILFDRLAPAPEITPSESTPALPSSSVGSLLEDALLEIEEEKTSPEEGNESQEALQAVKAEYEQEVRVLKEQMQSQKEQWQNLNSELDSTRSSLEVELDKRKISEEELEDTRARVQQELMNMNTELEQARFQLEEHTDEKTRLTEEKTQLTQELESLRTSHEKEIAEFEEKSEASISHTEEELTELQIKLDEELKATEENVQLKEDEISRKSGEIESLQERLGLEADKRQEIESELDALNQKLSRQGQENNALSMAHGMLQSELDDLKKVQQDFDSTLHEMEEKEKGFEDQQKELENDLLLQKQLVDTLESQVKHFGYLDLPVLTINEQGTISEWNKAAENALGPADYEAVGQGFIYLLNESEEEFDMESRVLSPLAEEGTLDITLSVQMRDGESQSTALHFTALYNSEGAFDGGIAYITPPRSGSRNEPQTADSLFEYSDLLVFRLSPGFETLDINPAATRLFGLERKDVFEKDFFNLILNEEQATEFREDVLDVYQSKTNSDFECLVKIQNNDERTLIFNLIKQENEAGDLHGILAIGQDLTDLRLSEQLLKDNETLLHSIVDHSADGFITIDESGIIQSFNSGAEKVFGYTTEETVGQNINLLMPEPYRSEHGNYISNYLVTGTAKVVGKPPREFMAQKKDGTVFPVEVAVREMFQDYRRLFVGIVHDITRRKAVEQALKESEEKFRKILSVENDAILIINTSTKRLLEANDAAVKLFGFDRDEILRLKLSDVSTEPDKKATAGNGGGLNRVTHSPMQYHKKKDGTVFPAEVSSSTFMAHNQKLNLRIIRDISVRVRMEENLREGEEHLQHILNNTPAAIYLKDGEGKYRTVNKQFAELFRVSQSDVRGKTDHDIFPQDLAEEFQKADQKVLESGTTFESKDTILYSDGAHIFDTIKFPLRNSSGVLYGIVGILSDITQRTRLEKELLDVRNHLEDMVVKRTEELHTFQDKRVRSEKLKATAQLAGVVAQQINNPIHGIRNILEQVGERVPMEDIHKGLVDIAIKECGRVSDLLFKLKDCHTPETDEPEDMDLNQVIEEVVANNQEKLGDQVTFEKHFAQGLPEIAGSTAQLRQALGHILQNAEEALPDHKGRILIATERDQDQIKIHIQDSGCGIPPENLDIIFDPFFTTKSAYKRSGLGLLLTLGVIKNHHGDIEVKSQPGKGTTFTIMLPVTAGK